MKIISILAFFAASALCAFAEMAKHENIPYTAEAADAYKSERLKLDVYIPEGKKDFATLVWFHGGGLTGGEKRHFPKALLEQGFAVVCPNYRLSPKIKAAEAVEDGADAIAWVFENIEKYGGNKNKIFAGGHSAGGYIAGMVGANPEYLKKRGIKNTDLAGLALVSGQVTTHFQVKKDFGDNSGNAVPKIDEYAVLGHVKNKMPPVCLILGDRKIEWPCRVQENELLAATLRELKTSPRVEFFEIQGKDHGTVAEASPEIIKIFIEETAR